MFNLYEFEKRVKVEEDDKFKGLKDDKKSTLLKSIIIHLLALILSQRKTMPFPITTE